MSQLNTAAAAAAGQPAILNFLGNVGLGDPTTRFLAGAAVATGLLWILKPGFAYDPSGQPLGWTVLDSKGSNTTFFPWFIDAILVGAILGLFI